MEKIGLCTPEGRPLDRWIRRDEEIPAGTGIRIVGVWAVEETGRMLITLRDAAKKSCPGCWENPGGAVRLGETPAEAASRELLEETGLLLEPGDLEEIDRHWTAPHLVYTFRGHCRRGPVRLQPGETADARWVTREELLEACRKGEMAEPIARQILRYQNKL